MTPESHTNPFSYLQRNAERNPRGIFSRSASQTVTNADALVSAGKLAFELRRLGVKPGQIVALDLPDQLGLLFAEAVYHEAAISTVVPPGVVLDGGMRIDWMFTSRDSLPQPGAQTVRVDAKFLAQIDENPFGNKPREDPIEVLRIAFSSGTTGTPKAIALGREMEAAMDASDNFGVGPALVLMDTGTPWGFGEFYLSVKGDRPFLSVGGAPETTARLAAECEVRSLRGSPAQFAALADALEADDRLLPTVVSVVVAGTAMPPGLADRLRQRLGEGCQIFGNYGSTESGNVTIRMPGSTDPFDLGYPHPGSELQIVDDDNQPVPAGQVGRIRHRAPGMAHEYVGDPEASALAFKDGWFYPGDLGFIRPDTGVTLVGRESEVLNAGGVKIDPTRIDHAALRVAGVIDACSFEYETASGVNQVGVAVVADDTMDVDALVAALTAEFGPAAPQLVARVDQIPRNSFGKPMRRTLAERYRES